MTELSSAIKEAIESVYEGWYANQRIDWEDFLNRVENLSDTDLGSDLNAPIIRAIKAYVRKIRSES